MRVRAGHANVVPGPARSRSDAVAVFGRWPAPQLPAPKGAPVRLVRQRGLGSRGGADGTPPDLREVRLDEAGSRRRRSTAARLPRPTRVVGTISTLCT